MIIDFRLFFRISPWRGTQKTTVSIKILIKEFFIMKNQKYILSALAALSVLTAATSVTAFAGEETTIPENNAP